MARDNVSKAKIAAAEGPNLAPEDRLGGNMLSDQQRRSAWVFLEGC